MQRYILKRLLQGIVTILLLTVVVFVLARVAGNPVNLLLPIEATSEQRVELTKSLGLDQPYPMQYYHFMKNAARFDFGTSLTMNRPVTEVFLQRLPNTLLLTGSAMLIALIIAVPLGIVAAVRRGGYVDRIALVVAVMGMAAPTFWIGLVLMYVVAVRLQLLPAAGMGGIEYLILPALTLGLFFVAGLFRLIRSGMLDVMDSEFVKLARMKGIPETWVVWKHCFRNALIPALSFAGVYVAILMGGSVVTETIFAWQGIGRLTFEAVMARDFPVIQGVIVMVGALIVLVNLMIDMLYAYIDPRIRYG